MSRRIAFYAPLKSPSHRSPSGDRTVARLYVRAFEQVGFTVDIVSHLRAFDGAGDGGRQQALMAEAAAEVERLKRTLCARPPALWFTYHCHYKAPDMLGPAVCGALNLPYVIAEPSYAPRRAEGAWARFHAANREAILAADLALVMTGRDWPAVAALRGMRKTVELPPFLDVSDLPSPLARGAGGPLRLVTLAMTRPGDKLASYRVLADAVAQLHADWQLTIIGDGAARAEVETLFARFGERVRFTGLIEERAALAAALGAADVMVWPAVGEAFGMAMLEGQAMGLPVVAGRGLGVDAVVRDGVTGLLTETGDATAFAGAVQRLADDPALRDAMGRVALKFAREERSLSRAAQRLGDWLAPMIEGSRCAS